MSDPDRMRDDQAASLRLAELLATRISHDLAGMSGSLVGTLELISEDASAAAEALPLAIETAQALARRLRLLRAAWGPPGSPMGLGDLQGLATGLSLGRRMRLHLLDLEDVAYPAPAARLLLNLMMLAVESLAGEGEAALAGGPEQGVLITIAGPRAAWPSGFAGLLADPNSAWQAFAAPRTLLAPLTVLIAAASGFGLSLLLAGGPAAATEPPPLLMRPFAAA